MIIAFITYHDDSPGIWKLSLQHEKRKKQNGKKYYTIFAEHETYSSSTK